MRSTKPTRALIFLAAALLIAVPSAAWAQTEDPDLDQTIEQGQAIVQGERVLSAGHVDMGPRFIDGAWTFLIHDDVAKADSAASSVWRYPEQTVFHVRDEGMLTVPEDPAYEFLGAGAGEPVWVSPQTQDPDVVWIGWNTQDPQVMDAIDRGITLTLHSVQGPGTMTVFLQSGSFGEPQVLWDSRDGAPQAVWVDVNTHTHANWTFTEPGVYLAELEASADLVDGSTVSDSQVVRFAVGSATDPAQALAASWMGSTTGADEATTEGENSDGADAAAPASDVDPVVLILVAAIALVAVGLVASVIVVVVRGSRARRRALGSASGDERRTESHDPAVLP